MWVVFNDYFWSQLYSNTSPLHFDSTIYNDRIYTLDSMCHIYIQRGVDTCHGVGVVRLSQGTKLGAKLIRRQKAARTKFTYTLCAILREIN